MEGKRAARTYIVTGVCCSTEETLLHKRLRSHLGGAAFSFDLVTCELRVDGSIESARVIHEVRAAGFGARDRGVEDREASFLHRHARAIRMLVAAMIAGLGAALRYNGALLPGGILIGVSLVFGGWEVFMRAFAALRQKSLDMNVLMTVAAAGAVVIGKYEEATAVVLLFSVSLMLESYAAERTRKAVKALMSLAPAEATRLHDDHEETLPCSDVRPGDLILVRPGSRIPLDGVIEDGVSTVSEAMLTGESTPVEKRPGMEVYAGCLNDRGALRVRVNRVFEETRLARILNLIEEARHERAPVQTAIDRFASWYTWLALTAAAIVALIPPLVTGQSAGIWLYRSLVLLVIACPCALVISTPVSIVSALTAAARAGVLIKGGRHLEALSGIKTMAFDKTGTITRGEVAVTDIVSLNGMEPRQLLGVVAAMEHRSEHPLAAAVLREAQAAGIDLREFPLDHFEALPGRGVRATIGGHEYFLGNRLLAVEHSIDTPHLGEVTRAFTEEGKGVIILGSEGEGLAVVAVKDVVRAESRGVVDELRSLGIQHLVLLSGDTEDTVRKAADEVGFSTSKGELLPDGKVEEIRSLRSRFGHVAMVGDGINDGPALAAATVGIAMGATGSDSSLETADVVLMGDRLSMLPTIIRLSRKTLSIIRQNIIFALAIKLTFVILSIVGVSTLWMALVADDGAAFIVILNGIRALRTPK